MQGRQCRVADTEEVVVGIKALPRDQDGVFDLRGMEGNQQDMQEARRVLYPVYAAYETNCNKKEGYPDILGQMRVMDERLQERYDMLEAAVYMDLALRTLLYLSQEVYEYYRELTDLYRKNARRFIREFYGEGKITPGAVPASPGEALFAEGLMLACREHILLEDKYEVYYGFMESPGKK